MKKKLLICALLSVAAVTASAALAGCNLFGGNDDGRWYRQDNMLFELKDDGTYEFSRYEYAYLDDGYDADDNYVPAYSGEGETVTVPDTVNGKKVTSIDGWAFGKTGVKEVTLSDVITELPDRIFDGCELLEKVNFPTVTSVGRLAFANCKKLESISFESGLTEIGERAFEYCTSLTEITLPDTVKTIGDNCFRECPFDSINTAGVEVLGNYALDECANITKLDLTNVVSIGERAFYYCNNLSELTIGNKLVSCEAGLTTLTKVSIDSPIPAKMFMWAGNLSDVTLGEGVTSIGEAAFGYCYSLNDITLPSTLTEIGDGAFKACGLTAVTVPASVKTICDNTFYSCGLLTSLTVENGVESIGKSAFEDTKITALSLPASVKTIGESAFDSCNRLAEINFSEGLESIGDEAFAISGAETLDIVLPSTVKTIGNRCFGGVTANKIIINDTVETVGKDVVKNCKVKELTAPVSYGHNAGKTLEKLTLFGEGDIPIAAYRDFENLKTVDLGGSIKKIYDRAFRALESITLDGVEYLGDYALGNLDELTYTRSENGVNYIDSWIISTDYSGGGATNLDLSGVTGIYQYAFSKTDTNDTSALKTVALTGSEDTSQLKFIGYKAFEGSGITGINVPASIQVWDYAFYGCTSLSAVAIQRGVEKIPEHAFAYCDSLGGINFAATDVTEIGEWAFAFCKNLRFVTLPDGIKKIGDSAFYECSSIMSVDLKGTEEVGTWAFCRCTSLGEITMNSVVKLGSALFYLSKITEIDLPDSVTEIGETGLSCVRTVNYAGTAEQWAAIEKYKYKGEIHIWNRDDDLTVIFADGGSVTYPKAEK